MKRFPDSLGSFNFSPIAGCLLLVASAAGIQETASANPRVADVDADPRASSVEKSKVAEHTIYGELFGLGPFYSLNYEHRFVDDASLRIGLGYLGGAMSNEAEDEDSSISFVPMLVNYLGLKAGNHILELGAGGIYATVRADTDVFSATESGLTALAVAQVGYRYQRLDGGLILRVGASALVGKGTRTVLPYVALGGAF